MLIASVKMKALQSPLITSTPLKMPTARPTASTTSTPTSRLHRDPSPSLPSRAMSLGSRQATRARGLSNSECWLRPNLAGIDADSGAPGAAAVSG